MWRSRGYWWSVSLACGSPCGRIVDAVSQLAIQWWAFHEHSVLSVYGTVALILIAGVVLTWRFLVSRLWSGLSGSRPLFMASVMSVVLVVIAGMVFAADRLPGWVLDDPARMAGVVWLMSIAVVAKCWLAAYSWRRVSARHLRQYSAGVGRRDHVLAHADDAAVGRCADLCGARHLPLPRLHDSRCATCRAARTRWVGTVVPGAKSPPLMRTLGMT